MSKVLDKAFLESVFPPERTEAFFDALFGGAEEGAYDIVLVCRSEGEGKAELAFELHQRPGDKLRWWLGHTEEISRSLHVIPLYLERTAD